MELTAIPSVGVYRATSVWSSPAPVLGARPHLKRQEAYGRGKTPDEARIGCIGEALERYSLIYRGDENLTRAQFGEIDAIHPGEVQLFSETQYREREAWNAVADEAFYVPERFDENATVDWIEARDLTGGDAKFVAAACCLMWYHFPPNAAEFARADTIGCGTGTTFEAALLHALLETIERDAMAIWWDNRLMRPGIILESFESPDLLAITTALRAVGRDLFLLDCTTDIGIPAYVSIAPRQDGSEPLIGGAAHPSARIAAYKAASEVGQVWYEAKRSGGVPECVRGWLLHETTDRHPYLKPWGNIEAPKEPGIPDTELLDEVIVCLGAVGLHAYAVDHSRTDVLWPTVRAVIPGLRHIWNRRAPGRLYTVPVKMGWLAEPVPEERLNPIRCMI